MKVLITGASSGLGRDMARILHGMGHEVILVARRKTRLEKLEKELGSNVKIIPMDLSTTYNCMELYNELKGENIDIVINNAGFGTFGEFGTGKLDNDLDMIDLNIKAVHTLTYLFLKDFKKKNNGYILNVASSAAFLPGPMMATYYATKAYVLSLTEAINEENKRLKNNVYVGCLCPGPVDTDFNKRAKVSFTVPSLDSYYVAKYGINKMLKRKRVIVPGIFMKISVFSIRLLPKSLILKTAYNLQETNKK
jgi:short-subunit dehydrogenase